jgi:hypothetical protein
MITEKFNSYFTEVAEDLLSQVNHHCPQQYLKFQTKNYPETIFVAPVIETEVIKVIKGLKNISSVGFDETPNIFSETISVSFHKAIGPHLCFFTNRYFSRHDEKVKSKTFI